MPETGVHLELRTALYLLVRDFVGERGAVGSDQFVYWDPSDPRQCLAPDLIVRIGASPGPVSQLGKLGNEGLRTWRSKSPAPFDAGEADGTESSPAIVSAESTRSRASIPMTLNSRCAFGIGSKGDLVERDLTGEHALLCDTLGVHWCVRADATLGRVLRLSLDALGQNLVPTAAERERAAAERIAELEAEVRRK